MLYIISNLVLYYVNYEKRLCLQFLFSKGSQAFKKQQKKNRFSFLILYHREVGGSFQVLFSFHLLFHRAVY